MAYGKEFLVWSPVFLSSADEMSLGQLFNDRTLLKEMKSKHDKVLIDQTLTVLRKHKAFRRRDFKGS